MKRKCTTLLLVLIPLLFAGLLLWKGTQIHYGISEGIYRMVTQADSLQQPFLHFDMENDSIRFVLGQDLRMSFAYRGTVELNGRVNLHCENGSEKWIFEVVDNDTIRFAQKGSSEFRLKEGTLPDGAIFQYAEE